MLPELSRISPLIELLPIDKNKQTGSNIEQQNLINLELPLVSPSIYWKKENNNNLEPPLIFKDNNLLDTDIDKDEELKIP